MTDAAPGAGSAPVAWQQARIAAIAPLTARIGSFFLEPSIPIRHVAGQHVDLRLTAPDGYQAMRSYSIASAPGQGDVIELAIERLDDGEVSSFFHDVAEVGDLVELRGPLGGHFVWRPDDPGPLLLIGGGSGVAPLMAMARQRALVRVETPAALLMSARTRAEAPFLDELADLAGRPDGLIFSATFTREAPVRPGDHGRRIDPAMVGEVVRRLGGPPAMTYICGSNGFVNASADSALAAGVARERIRTERYGG